MTLESLRTMLDIKSVLDQEQSDRAARIEASGKQGRCPVQVARNGRISMAATQNSWGDSVIRWTFTGATIVKSRTPMESGDFSFDTRLPKRSDKNPDGKIVPDSELGHVAASLLLLGISNPIESDGMVGDIEESYYELTQSQWVDDPNGSKESTRNPGTRGDFKDVSKGLFPYYRFTRISKTASAATNGTSQSGSGCDPAALLIANEYSLTHNDDELAAGGKLAQALQQAGAVFANGQNGPLQSACINGTLREFLAQHYAEIPAPAGVGGSN